jgi:hypothetical protein
MSEPALDGPALLVALPPALGFSKLVPQMPRPEALAVHLLGT